MQTTTLTPAEIDKLMHLIDGAFHAGLALGATLAFAAVVLFLLYRNR